MGLDFGEKLDAAIARALLDIAAMAWRDEPRVALEAAGEVARDWGRFPHELLVRMLDEGRSCELLAKYDYYRPDGSLWRAPAETIVDGASIPRAFWTLIGGPFEGKYRNASVIHDFFCDTRRRPWRDTHRMFYEAMRCKGVGPAKAKVMYYAVYRFGPRWPDPGALVPESLTVTDSRPLTAADAPMLRADAEAIYVHDLSIDAIEALADARDASATVYEAVGEGRGARHARRARALIVVGGRGTAADLDAVAAAAAALPGYVLALFERRRIRIVACRDSVTDFETDLRGKTPRGWESTGRTWDNVPGVYFQERRRVVIATIDAGGARRVPDRSSGLHGSKDLVVHECLHGFDYAGNHAVLRDPNFVDARAADLNALDDALNGYLVQPGQAGLEETFAESGARFAVSAADVATVWPHLHSYWQAGPVSAEAGDATPTPEAAAGPDQLGTAVLKSSGAIALDLRADAPGGGVGHAAFTVMPDDPSHARLRWHLLRGRPRPETTGDIRVPFNREPSDSTDPMPPGEMRHDTVLQGSRADSAKVEWL